MSPLLFPYQITRDGRTATADRAMHVRNMIEQVLFTIPGERVNRPTFGSGLQQLVFAPSSDELAAGVEFLIQSALLQWLGDIIRVESVDVEARDSSLLITVSYVILANQEPRVDLFTRELFEAP